MSEREKKLEALGYPLDRIAGTGRAIFRPVTVDGTTAYLSGAVPFEGREQAFKGKVVSQVGLEEAQKAAALCAANLLRVVHRDIGSLDRIEQLLKLTGYVNSDPDFTEQHLVLNGASKLFIDVLGPEVGLASRSAVGMVSLPLGCPVEADLILKLKG